MKQNPPKNIQKYRMRTGPRASDESFGMNGAFIIPYADHKLHVLVSDGGGWDHASVSLPNRCPTWAEMCFIKNLFFHKHETAIQYHPKETTYINHHPFVLYIWRPQGVKLQMPPLEFV